MIKRWFLVKFSIENTIITLRHYGHMGSVDTLFGLAQSLEKGKIHPGDLVVLATSGLGFVWGATVLKFN